MSEAATETPAATGYICDVCGEEFKLAMHLGTHKKNVHGIAGHSAGKNKKRTSTGTRNAPQESRKTKVRRTLVELANLSDDMRGRGETDLPRYLSDVIRRDADQLATAITFAADKFQPFRVFVDRVFVQIVGPAVGASGVFRWVIRRVREQAQARAEAVEYGPELTPEEAAQPAGDGRTWRGMPLVPRQDEPDDADAA